MYNTCTTRFISCAKHWGRKCKKIKITYWLEIAPVFIKFQLKVQSLRHHQPDIFPVNFGDPSVVTLASLLQGSFILFTTADTCSYKSFLFNLLTISSSISSTVLRDKGIFFQTSLSFADTRYLLSPPCILLKSHLQAKVCLPLLISMSTKKLPWCLILESQFVGEIFFADSVKALPASEQLLPILAC